MSPPVFSPARSIPEGIRDTASRYAELPVIIQDGHSVSFAELDAITDRIAAGLQELGVRKGDRVALYCMNSDRFAIAYCGIVKAGGVVVPINLLLNPKEVAFILEDSAAQVVLHAAALSDAVQAIRPSASRVRTWVSMEEGSGLQDATWGRLIGSREAIPALSFNPAEDVAAILYTSGTTGRPKGAMLTHRNLVSNTYSILEALQLQPRKDILLVVLPMFHSFAATVGMLFPILHGCTLVPLPRFDPERVANAVAETRATIFLGVPSMYAMLLRLGDEHVSKLDSLRYCVSGGAALPGQVQESFESRFGKLIYEGDGPTECSPVTCVNPLGGLRKRGSVGVPVPGVEMSIRDDAGHEVPDGIVGEICVRGPNVMPGYWNLPEATAESFFGDRFRTGDLGYRDEEGYFFIVDRKKDMIIVNGMNVYPRMIEEVLHRHPAVSEAAVVGEPHSLHGEIPIAYVATRDGMAATDDELRSLCREYLGRHEVPRKFRFLPQLPKSGSGKILKRELRRVGEIERGIDLPNDERG